MDKEELKKQLLKVEKSINNIVDNFDVKIELEELETKFYDGTIKFRYKVVAVVPEKKIY